MNLNNASSLKTLAAAALIGVLASTATAASAPTLKTLARVELGPAVYGAMKYVKDAAGKPLLVAVQTLPGETQIQNLVAVDESGKIVGQSKIWASQLPDKLVSIRDVGYNSRGELIVITGVGSNITGDMQLNSVNLSKDNSNPLITTGRSPQFGGRLLYKGKNLVVVTSDLNARTNTADPSLVRVMDEDSGKVVMQTILDQQSEGELGVDSKGNLKILIRGYELFGLVDVATSTYSDLIPPRQQPSAYPGHLELSIGSFVTLSESGTEKLLNRKDLFDGIVKPVRSFPTSTQFIGEKIPEYAVYHGQSALRITNLKTGAALGPDIPLGIGGRVETTVTQVLITTQGPIALLDSPKRPSSYVRGSILEYVNVKTGAVLRRTEDMEVSIQGQLILNGGGEVLTVETVPEFTAPGRARYKVVSLTSGKEVSSGTNDLIGKASRSSTGRLFALEADGDQTCVIDLLSPADKTCVSDPKAISAVKYGYEPFSIDGSVVTLPLLQPAQSQSDSELGYLILNVD